MAAGFALLFGSVCGSSFCAEAAPPVPRAAVNLQAAAQQVSQTVVNPQTAAVAATPLEVHGALRVQGTKLVDKQGEPVRLMGMSTHGMAWFPQYVSQDTFQTLRDDWKTNCVRLALYTEEYNGYCSGGNQEELKALVRRGVEAATNLGMYVIIDWHVLNDRDPNVHREEARAFFAEMSALYRNQENVLYEICNEPNSSATWEQIKQYAGEVIPVIRGNDPDAVIIVGTPNWSQDIHLAADSPLPYDNLLYALHFYAATHTDWLRERLTACVQRGLPVFVSEFGLCDASGNGNNDFVQARQWMDLLEQYDIGCCNWNLANKAESSSVILPGCTKISGWSDEELSEGGRWISSYWKEQAGISTAFFSYNVEKLVWRGRLCG